MVATPKSRTRRITVLLAEDHTVVREGLRALLQGEGEIEVVAEAETGRQAVAMTKKHRPDVVVLDIAMPLLNGLEATRQILKALPATKILVLSAHSDDAYVEQAIALGAMGYLLKESSARMLAKAVRAVHRGNVFFSPVIARRLRQSHGRLLSLGKPERRKRGGLSSRQVEVLQLIAEGQPNKRIAAELRISIKTVEKHRQHLMEKLNIHDTAGLTRYAIAAGIIESSVQVTIV
jgi:DNA-binding NarL/FixJ family response regulator